MSQITDIIVFDGASPPVSHTLTAMSVTRDKNRITAEWQEISATIPSAASIRCTMVKELLSSGVIKTEMRIVVPVMESPSGTNAAGYTAAPKVAYEDTVVTITYSHPRSTVAGRRLARMISVNISNNITATVNANTGGPYPNLVDSLIVPT